MVIKLIFDAGEYIVSESLVFDTLSLIISVQIMITWARASIISRYIDYIVF